MGRVAAPPSLERPQLRGATFKSKSESCMVFLALNMRGSRMQCMSYDGVGVRGSVLLSCLWFVSKVPQHPLALNACN